MFSKDLVVFPYIRRPPVESIWSPNSKKGSWYPLFFDEYRSMFLMERELVPMGAIFLNVVLRIARQIFFPIYRGGSIPRPLWEHDRVNCSSYRRADLRVPLWL